MEDNTNNPHSSESRGEKRGRQLTSISPSQQFDDDHQQLTTNLTSQDLEKETASHEELGESSTTIRNNYAAPVSHFDLSNASNVSLTLGEQRIKGCLTNENLSARITCLNDVFVEVQPLKKAKQLLKAYGHVTVCGAPGDGKSSIALMLCKSYRSKNFETMFVERTEDFDVDVISIKKKNLLIVFDDIFGSVTFSCNLEKMHKLFRELTDIIINMARKIKDVNAKRDKQSKLRVVMTSRTYNLNAGCSQLSLYKANLFRKETILDLTKEGLTADEKTNIISSFRDWSKFSDFSSEDLQTFTNLQNDMFGFPFICKLYFTTPAFQLNTANFFRQPICYLRGDLDLIVQEGSNRSAAIILLVLCGGSLNLVSFQLERGKGTSTEDMFLAVTEIVPSCTRTNIGKEIKNFRGTYCTVEQQTASFSHPSIYDAAACAFGKLNIILLLKYCSLRFLFERIRVMGNKSVRTAEPDDVTNMIYIDEDLFSLAVSRLVEGIHQRYFGLTVNHPILSDDCIASSLLTELEDVLPTLAEEKDRETEKSFLYWVTLSDSHLLFEKVLNLFGEMIQSTSECLRPSTGNSKDLDCFGGMSLRTEETTVFSNSDRNMDGLNEALVSCVQNGKLAYLKSVTALLHKINSFNVNFRNEENKSLIMIATERGHVKVFDFLIQERADPTSTDKARKNCLHVSAESGTKDIAEYILEKYPELIDESDADGRTPALICSEVGHVHFLKFLVSKGADLDVTDTSAWNCLHLACMEGHSPIVKYLVSLKKSSLDINRRDGLYNQTPVMLAAEGGHYDVYKVLVSEGADLTLTDYDNKDCLMFASEKGNLSIVKHLLSLETLDINKRGGFSNQTPVMFAAERGHYDVFRLLESKGADLSLKDKYNRDCLMWACVGGDVSIMKHLLSLKIYDINRKSGLYDNTPVSMAACKGHYDIYFLLVSEGADLYLTDKYDRDCLMLACVGGNSSVVKHLLSQKMFDINRRAGLLKRTPVMVAAENGQFDVYNLLVSEGANLSLTDKDNKDCLMWACFGGSLSIVKHLLSLKRFDVNRKGGPDNETPVMMAAKRGHSIICNLLVSEGADS